MLKGVWWRNHHIWPCRSVDLRLLKKVLNDALPPCALQWRQVVLGSRYGSVSFWRHILSHWVWWMLLTLFSKKWFFPPTYTFFWSAHCCKGVQQDTFVLETLYVHPIWTKFLVERAIPCSSLGYVAKTKNHFKFLKLIISVTAACGAEILTRASLRSNTCQGWGYRYGARGHWGLALFICLRRTWRFDFCLFLFISFSHRLIHQIKLNCN